MTADRELLQNDCLLLLDHGTAGYVAACGVCINILKLVSASANHEVAATDPRKSHGASTVRIHGIGSGENQIPIIAEYKAATEVEDQTCREAACAIKRPPRIMANTRLWARGGVAPRGLLEQGPS